jgi:GNAT superfamily N-acetyltransferase
MRVQFQDVSERRRVHGWTGWLGDEPVTVGFAHVSLKDNTDRMLAVVHTVPAHCRRGHGGEMMAHLEQVARDLGRSILVTEVNWPWSAGPEGAGDAGADFARRHGFVQGLSDAKRLLDLPVHDGLLDELEALAAPHHAAYRLVTFTGAVPEEHVAGWAELTRHLMTEAPVGDLTVEPEQVSVQDVRDAEETTRRQGRARVATSALDAAGEVVAYTELQAGAEEPERAYQWGTLVRRADRGHRLGLAIKVAALRRLVTEFPRLHGVITYNSESNAPMVAVNEQLGYRPIARMGEFEKHLD